MAANIETVRGETIRYANEVRRHLPVDRAYLFGSYAKGTADQLSDVDVCFFLRDFGGKDRIETVVQLLGLARDYDAYFEPHVFETADLDNDNPFVKEILRTGVEI